MLPGNRKVWPRLSADGKCVARRLEGLGQFQPLVRGKAFARLKAMLRKAGERTVSSLWSLIGRLVDLFQPQECANYFN